MIDDAMLAEKLERFADERDWRRFHTPKNIASALSVEASELREIFQWTRGQHDWNELDAEPAVRQHTEEELADITLAFRGSKNQRVLNLPATLTTGEPVLYLE